MKKLAVDRRRARSWPRVRQRGQRADQDRRRRPHHRPERRFRRAAEERRRAGGRGHQCGRRHQRPEAPDRRRRRRVRSEAGRVGGEQVRRRRRQDRRRPLQLRRLDPGLRSLRGERHRSDHARPRRTRKFTERGLWNTFRTCGRDDQQGAVAGEYLADKFKGKKVAIVHDKTPYGKGLADETQKAMNARASRKSLYEGVNTGEKDYLGSRLQDEVGGRRRRLLRRPAHRSRPDRPPDARPGPQGLR